MKAQAERARQVVILSDHKKWKETKTPVAKDPAKILAEVSYHLLQAAKAISGS